MMETDKMKDHPNFFSDGDEQRKKLYKLFSENLNSIRNEDFIQLEPDIPNSYICPLCMRHFTIFDLDQARNNCLTLEDVPPKSLGGRPLTLTCKECNNTAGSLLEEELRKKLITYEFLKGVTGAIVDAKIRMDDELSIYGTLSHRNGGGLNVHLYRNGPKAAPQKSQCVPRAIDHLKNKNLQKFQFNTNPYKNRNAEVALLRIAYLIAFCTFGNSFLFNENLGLVREQIQKPNSEILPSLGLIKDDFSKIIPGVYLITAPREMHSFLVIFELVSNQTSKHGVMLPGPSEPGLAIYTLRQQEPGSSGFKYHAIRIPDKDYLKDQSLKFSSMDFWNQVVTHGGG